MEDVQSITLSYTFFRSATASPEKFDRMGAQSPSAKTKYVSLSFYLSSSRTPGTRSRSHRKRMSPSLRSEMSTAAWIFAADFLAFCCVLVSPRLHARLPLRLWQQLPPSHRCTRLPWLQRHQQRGETLVLIHPCQAVLLRRWRQRPKVSANVRCKRWPQQQPQIGQLRAYFRPS